MIKTHSDLLPSQLELLVFKTICKDASITLVHTPRLQGIIQQFTSILGSQFKETSPEKIPEFIKHIEDSPPWVIRVVASEFVHEEQFQQTRREQNRSQRGPLSTRTKRKRVRSGYGRGKRRGKRQPSTTGADEEDDDIKILETTCSSKGMCLYYKM